MADKNKSGRPCKFKSANEIQVAIDEYFKACEGEILKDHDGNVIFDKYGEPIIINSKPPTVTGLALFLGLKSRQAILNYQDRPEFNDAITRAKMRIEEYAETRLYDKNGCNGAKFNLTNNFGWVDRQQTELTGKDGGPVAIKSETDLSKLSVEELRQLEGILQKAASDT
jgi:hypothetical protein